MIMGVYRMLSKKLKLTFSLIAYTLLFNVVCYTVNIISFEYAQIGYISTYVILVLQLLLLPIYFYFVGTLLEKIQFKQFVPFIVISVLIGILLILFSSIYYASASMVDLYIQGLVCSLFPISQLIEQYLFIQSTALYVGVTVAVFLLEIFCKILFIKLGNKQ